MKFTLHAYGILPSWECIFCGCYIVDNEVNTKCVPKGCFQGHLL